MGTESVSLHGDNPMALGAGWRMHRRCLGSPRLSCAIHHTVLGMVKTTELLLRACRGRLEEASTH